MSLPEAIDVTTARRALLAASEVGDLKLAVVTAEYLNIAKLRQHTLQILYGDIWIAVRVSDCLRRVVGEGRRKFVHLPRRVSVVAVLAHVFLLVRPVVVVVVTVA